MSANPELVALLDELLAVRGATVAALVDGVGQMVEGRSHDEAALERAAGMLTSALAAATALGELLPEAGEGEAREGEAGARPSQLMLNLDNGPVLFVPLTASNHVVVMGVAAEGDLGRARLAVKGRLPRLEDLAAAVSGVAAAGG